MKIKISILRIVAWAIIGIWFTRGLIFRLINIDFATIEVARNFRNIWVLLIPIAVVILIIEAWNEKTSKSRKIIGLLMGLILSSGLIIVLNFFSSFCEWQFNYIWYEHQSKNMKIQNRFLDCGATTSGDPYELVITKPIGNYLIKYELIEKADIDTLKWNKK